MHKVNTEINCYLLDFTNDSTRTSKMILKIAQSFTSYLNIEAQYKYKNSFSSKKESPMSLQLQEIFREKLNSTPL